MRLSVYKRCTKVSETIGFYLIRTYMKHRQIISYLVIFE